MKGMNQYRRTLYAEYAVCVGHQLPGGHHPSCSKKTKTTWRHSRIRTRDWMQMIMDNCPWKDISNPAARKKKMKTKPVPHCQEGYIHNPVKLFWVLRLLTCFNVSNNFTTTNASNIFSELPCSPKLAMVLTRIIIIIINHSSCSHGNRKLTMFLLLQIIIYKEV